MLTSAVRAYRKIWNEKSFIKDFFRLLLILINFFVLAAMIHDDDNDDNAVQYLW